MEFNKPSPLKMTGNLIDNFKMFKQEFQIFFDATECHMKKEATQVAILLNLLGPDGLKVYNTLKVKNETVCKILNALESYCISRKNEIMGQYLFFTRNQGAEEPFENFYTDLKQLIKTCGFDQFEEKLLRIQIVLGISNKDVQTSLLREYPPLERMVNHWRAPEQTKLNRKVIRENNTTSKSLFNIEINQKPKYRTNSNGRSTQESNSKSDSRQLIKTCGFDQFKEKLLRIQIVLGISNKDVQTSLLREYLPLERAVNHWRAPEQTKRNRKVIQENNTTSKSLFNIEISQKPKYGRNSNGRSTQESNSKSDSKGVKIPVKWLDFTPYSLIVCNTFLPFKTPLDSKYRVPMRHIFKTNMLFSSMAEKKVDLGLWIDLTNSNRYYDPLEVINNNCRYVKLPLAGRGIPPTCKEVESFLDICWDFVNSNPNLYIGVHCTRGLNRTGFLIVAWLIEVLHYTVNSALQEFAAARPPGITRQSYIDELYHRYED
ncbi:Protein-tyrosine phosphatase-like,Dual specificity phosphatase, catalytic domain,Tyrosine [Cinara cedri]|uniref:Protein-tyrosine phosphatase-like,Dual specificity phosphatase, catalytic domain,Tyrosine n=1 Tax=Cinara cedri TaxID=506608 RepID=A0A5E4M8E7_9HEMI|nr:Protein-tyrosine phosphatase-like,Dual specificity phosphatase, catalytic domain,Tyrosine [Cinara cedri]